MPPHPGGVSPLASDKERLEKLLKRAKRLGYLEQSFPTVSELANIADAKLLFSILHNSKHVFHQLLIPIRPLSSHQLRPRAHNHTLPPKDNSQFIPRSLGYPCQHAHIEPI